ncbi:hypothetical protein BpHYR1_007676 [Brachionus plicatilis]|uniref:Uncharacterized protein n=1 Tax=Brachionus plicatilis TaxID=10195 RepID=A0A3M7QYA7_BRAPC|nr:hypothetical protein BpHYR1_007676 [Brachionus plicatilis]
MMKQEVQGARFIYKLFLDKKELIMWFSKILLSISSWQKLIVLNHSRVIVLELGFNISPIFSWCLGISRLKIDENNIFYFVQLTALMLNFKGLTQKLQIKFIDIVVLIRDRRLERKKNLIEKLYQMIS